MTEVFILVAVLAVATAFGLWRRSTDGRVRQVSDGPVTRTGAAAGPDGGAPETARAATEGESAAADDSEPLIVGGSPVEVADHSVVPAAAVLSAADVGQELGERATLLQFSSAFCSPCRATRVVLGEVATMVEGTRHVEIDAESHLDLVRRLDVTRTPTVFVLDAGGRIRSRATGAPRRADVIAALGSVV